jgi:hypothetical protein
MTQEEKEILLKDLCARLPYSTLCYCKWTKDAPNDTSGCVQEVSTYLLEELMIIGDQNYECQICEIKPYLRPMSSMTNEEWEDFNNYRGVDGVLMPISNELDWLNEHHFDYRGLIKKGLALEAPEEMY